jgi:type I restriction-modification system DNA methylase subunit
MAKGKQPANDSGRRADLVPVWKDLANPPFNLSDWGGENLRPKVRVFSLSASNGERAGVRCRILIPPMNNANYASVQHVIHQPAPHGMAGLNAVRQDIANGSMSSNEFGEGDICGYQLRPLPSLCDTLLPKLLSGELKTTN